MICLHFFCPLARLAISSVTISQIRFGRNQSNISIGINFRCLFICCMLTYHFSYSFLFLGRRNPFRMLSNAIDFRNRRKVQRPKSADQERGGGGICANPSGGKTVILFSKEKNSSKRSTFFCLFLVNYFFQFWQQF